MVQTTAANKKRENSTIKSETKRSNFTIRLRHLEDFLQTKGFFEGRDPGI